MELPTKKCVCVGFCVLILISYYNGYPWAMEDQAQLSETPSASPVQNLYMAKRQLIQEPESELDDEEKINSERVKTMDDYCNTLHQQPNQATIKDKTPRYLHSYVDDKHKLIFCTVAKVACSNVKRMILGLDGVKDPFETNQVHEDPRLEKKRLFRYSPKEIAYRLKHYTKAIVVRDPLQRALSAYRDKLVGEPSRIPVMQKIFGSMILKKYHPNLPNDVVKKGAGVTFQEFVRYLTHPLDFMELEPRDEINGHWDSYFSLCDPCAVRYDIIAKYETLDEDVSFILKRINSSNLINWPRRSERYKLPPTSQLVSEALRNISSEDLKAFNAHFYHDYKVFGYKFQEK